MTTTRALFDARARLLNDAALRFAERITPNTVPLAPAIDAERKTMTTHRWQSLSYYVDHRATGRPIVLLHSVNACASSYEMRPLFERCRGSRPVYALDLPGFGLSGREDRPYTVDLFADSIRELVARAVHRDGEADVVALSLTGEFAARVAAEHKHLFHSLTLISPTGFARWVDGRPRPLLERARGALEVPAVGEIVFDAIASRPSIGYFLRKSFVSQPDPDLQRYAYATAHQPGARHAPLAFVSGKLFTPDVRETVYAGVHVPTLVVYDRDGYTTFEELGRFVAAHPNWSTERIVPSRGMPQFEQPGVLVKVLDAFWERSKRTH